MYERSQSARALKVLLVAGLALLFAHGVTAQTRPSDAEMKEVVRLLLEREVPRNAAEGGNVAVLFGPNVNSNWIPEAPGFTIRQLSYDEQKKVSEFYDLTSSSEGNVIKIELVKGNYCRRSGPRYEFRREAGSWRPKLVGYIESTTIGGHCEGCTVGSGGTNSSPRRNTNPPKPAPPAGNLRLTGSVRNTNCSRDPDYVRCKVDLDLKFTNTGTTPLIILQPHGEYEFWHGGTLLALSEKESESDSYVYDTSAWPSIYKFPMYQTLATLLDQKVPPPSVTRVLAPSASWSWNTSINLNLEERNSCNQHVGVEIGWDEIKRRTSPLWLRVSFEMWPFNVENFKPNLGGILQKRWKAYGSLYLEEKSGRYWQARLRSEPIEFPLHQIDLAEQNTRWLSYEPATVELEGRLTIESKYGPPNYGENPKTDAKVKVPVLVLSTPINVRGTPADEINGTTVRGARRVQLVFSNLETSPTQLIGDTVVVRGKLFHAHTGHHYTDVLIDVSSIEAKQKQPSPKP